MGTEFFSARMAMQTSGWLSGASRAALGGALAVGGLALAPAAWAEPLPTIGRDILFTDGNSVSVSLDDGEEYTSYDIGYRIEQRGGGSISMINYGLISNATIAAIQGLADADTTGFINLQQNGTISASEVGLYANHAGSGAITISTAVGSSTSTRSEAVHAIHSGSGAITAELFGSLSSEDEAVMIEHQGSGNVSVTVGEDASITSQNPAVSVVREPQGGQSGTGNTSVVFDTGSLVRSQYYGLYVSNKAAGNVDVDLRGTIQVGSPSWGNFYAGACGGIYALQFADGDMNITLSGLLQTGMNGIGAYMPGYQPEGSLNQGNMRITLAEGAALFAEVNGIDTAMYRDGDLIISLAENTLLRAGSNAIYATKAGNGAFSITNAGQISGGNHGIAAIRTEAGLLSISNSGHLTAQDVAMFGYAAAGDIEAVNTSTVGSTHMGDSMPLTTGVLLNAAGSVTFTNSGLIESHSNRGVALYGSTIALENSGHIDGSVTFAAFVEDLKPGSEITVASAEGPDLPTLDSARFINTKTGSWSLNGTFSDLGANAVLENYGTIYLNTASNSDFAPRLRAGAIINSGDLSLMNGTLSTATIYGDLSFKQGGVLSLDVMRDDAVGGPQWLLSDTLKVNGLFDKTNMQLNVNVLDGGTLQRGDGFIVAQAKRWTGSFTPQFTSIFLGFREAKEGELDALYKVPLPASDDEPAPILVLGPNLKIVYDQLRDFAAVALSPNQTATAQGLQSLDIPPQMDTRVAQQANPLFDAVLHLNSEAEAQSAFDQLSGELHPAIRTAMAEDSRLPRNAVLGRLDAVEKGSLWGQIFYNTGTNDRSTPDNTAAVTRNTKGFLLGADASLSEDVVVGVAGAYVDSDLDQTARAGEATHTSGHAFGYIGAKAGKLKLKAGLGYAWGEAETHRDVAFTGFEDHLDATYDTTLWQAFAEAGVPMAFAGGTVEPFAQIAHVQATSDAFAEEGAEAALTAEKATTKTTVSTLGLRLETAANGVFSVGGMVGWQHNFGTLTPESRFAFAGGDSFSVAGADQSRNAAVIGVEARARIGSLSSIGLGYDGVLGANNENHAAKLSFRLAF
ncbi:autotransporter domain-containing protein [Altererythrobacter sp. CC-YST694]|uniref:autotransporter outer membrane beta-barrel domain-containing protein n=1 Tax=Altererythrobacter sp. CC-YST694 TaxID=2755038 RepID=UPI001D02A12E|nr:autotransporter domain-containing protein [Altererythrobacter sp. CC-YST694]MCB5426402.1 autotransporter domain-containing protein [Altererythrobacter sp. CC-YST694]